jgi:hypothetical protein
VPFVSKLFPKWHCKRLFRTDPLKTLVIGGFVRGLSMRDIESLCEEVGLGTISRSTVARICAELHERFEAFKRRSLYDTNLVVLFLDAIFLPAASITAARLSHPLSEAAVVTAHEQTSEICQESESLDRRNPGRCRPRRCFPSACSFASSDSIQASPCFSTITPSGRSETSR